MIDSYRAAVLGAPLAPLTIETVRSGEVAATDVVVRIAAAGLCHTDLEVIEGALRLPFPIVLGHEAAGVVVEVGRDVADVRPGDHVVLSWNPHCGHCSYCDRDLPILCEQYIERGPVAFHFDGRSRATLADGRSLHHLMYLGAFGEYVIVDQQQAIRIPEEVPLDVACLIGCGVMTGVGAALNIAHLGPASSVMVIGCGAVGLAAIQGARLAGAQQILATDLSAAKCDLAGRMGASKTINASLEDALETVRAETKGRGVDCVIEAAGSASGFRLSVEAVRPGGEVIWLGKLDVAAEVSFRWGALMQEKSIRRSSYGNARPARDFPMLAHAVLEGRLQLDELITQRIALRAINEGFEQLRTGNAIRSVIIFE